MTNQIKDILDEIENDLKPKKIHPDNTEEENIQICIKFWKTAASERQKYLISLAASIWFGFIVWLLIRIFIFRSLV